jgi:hypothetical protein
MDVGLYARQCVAKVHLCIAVISVVGLDCEPTIEVVTVANQQSAGVRGTIEITITRAVMSEKSRALEAHF